MGQFLGRRRWRLSLGYLFALNRARHMDSGSRRIRSSANVRGREFVGLRLIDRPSSGLLWRPLHRLASAVPDYTSNGINANRVSIGCGPTQISRILLLYLVTDFDVLKLLRGRRQRCMHGTINIDGSVGGDDASRSSRPKLILCRLVRLNFKLSRSRLGKGLI